MDENNLIEPQTDEEVEAILMQDEIDNLLDELYMIDDKYLDYLADTSNDYMHLFAYTIIEDIIKAGICKVSGHKIDSTDIKDIDFGWNDKNGNHLISADIGDGRSIEIQISPDFSTVFLSTRLGEMRISLDDNLQSVVARLIERVLTQSYEYLRRFLPFDPLEESLSEFVNNLRYGNEEYLKNEFIEIFNSNKQKIINNLEEALVPIARKLIAVPKIGNIINFLKANNQNVDNIHITIK